MVHGDQNPLDIASPLFCNMGMLALRYQPLLLLRRKKRHLVEFAKKQSYPLSFETINLDFFYLYTDFLKKKLKLAHNIIAKDISLIKVFMGEAVDLGYTSNMVYKHKNRFLKIYLM